MAKGFRPRLDAQEVEYLVSVLKWYKADLEEKMKEIEAVEREVFSLTRKLSRTGPITADLRELGKKRERLQQLRSARYIEQRVVVQDFVRRLEGLLNGKKPHPTQMAEWMLSRLTEA